MGDVQLFGEGELLDAIPGEPVERPRLYAVFRDAREGKSDAPRESEAPPRFPLPPALRVDRDWLARLATRDETAKDDPLAFVRDRLRDGVRLDMDVPLRPAKQGGPSWYANGAAPRIGTRAQALHHLRQLDPGAPTDCGDVGVIVFDTGLSADYVAQLGGTFGGGLGMEPLRGGGGAQGSTQRPGEFLDPYARTADGHGNMIARNVLSLAPSATIYDVPILPERVTDLAGYSSWLVPLLDGTIALIEGELLPDGSRPPHHERWILVNAWSVATSFADLPGPLAAGGVLNGIRYMDNRLHALNERFVHLAAHRSVDVVFAAGNAGAHAPDPFSGPYDRGPGRSIKGSNGLEEVWTVGAVDVGARPIAMSSEGPSLRELLAGTGPFGDGVNRKPDVSVPSWFGEDDDPSLLNTGTSAACGLFAGYLACLRSGGRVPDVSGFATPSKWSRSAGWPLPTH